MDMDAPGERRETSWSAWYGEVLSVAALAPALIQRASQVFAPFAPAPEIADELSRAYAARTVDCARRALRAPRLLAARAVAPDEATVVPLLRHVERRLEELKRVVLPSR